MTANTGGFDARDRRPNDEGPGAGYRWTCPFCGRSRVNKTDGESGPRNARAALRTHVLATDGGGHGPRNGLPDGDLDLAEHVEAVGGGPGTGEAG